MTVISLDERRRPYGRLAAADDAQRGLLACVLRDAAELHCAAMDDCPQCQVFPQPGGPCDACWQARRPVWRAYHALADRLASHDGRPYGDACPLADADRRVFAAALRDAIAYRQQHTGSGLEHHVLLMAYREMQRHQDTH